MVFIDEVAVICFIGLQMFSKNSRLFEKHVYFQPYICQWLFFQYYGPPCPAAASGYTGLLEKSRFWWRQSYSVDYSHAEV